MLFLKNEIPVQEYSPIELKKYITGNGKADKMLVQRTIMRFFKLADLPEFNDAADALGLAYLAKLRR
jgi:crossover junction endodeoxyribonuclease RuvC